jgi:hypothetical protein
VVRYWPFPQVAHQPFLVDRIDRPQQS